MNSTFSPRSHLVISAATAVVLAITANATDQIRRWRDDEGRLHIEVRGPESDANAEDVGVPLLRTTEASPEQKFSTDVSRRRRAIEKRMIALGAELAGIEGQIAETDSKQIVVYAPALGDEGHDPQSVVDAQRNAFLSAERFKREKAERLRQLRRQQRERLRELRVLWKDFDALRTEVRTHYGSMPTWFRDRIDCPACPTAEQISAALARRPSALPTPTVESEEQGADW